MLKLPLYELYAARDVLQKLAMMDFSVRTGYLIARLIKAVNGELIQAEEKKRELYRKYGEQDADNGNLWKLKPENQEEVNRQFKDMLEVEIELACDPIPVSVLDGERLPTHERLLSILIEVREQKRAPLDAIPEIRGLTMRLAPAEILRIEKFIIQD